MKSAAIEMPKHLENLDTRLFINGEFQSAAEDEQFKITNPFNGEVIAQVHGASDKDTNDAVSAAKAAFPAWRDLDPSQRGVYIRRLSDLIRESHDELAYLETTNIGRPISQFFLSEVTANFLRFFAERGWAARGTTSYNTPNYLNMSVKQPYGVTVCMASSNLPLLIFGYDVGPALAAGNTVVLKSDEKAPLSIAYAAGLVKKAGFPPGVLNIVTGAKAGPCLASHMDFRCLSHISSFPVAQKIQAAAAQSNLKVVRSHLSAKSPALVFADADLKAAVEQRALSIGFLNGQSCMANSRIYVEESIASDFKALFRQKFDAFPLGDPRDPKAFVGPQRSEAHYERVMSFIDASQQYKTMTIGESIEDNLFIKPTMFEDVPEDSPLAKEEIFGPVVVINTFKTEFKAVEKANDTPFGLYAAVFTKDFDRILRLPKTLEAGTVCVNCTSPTVADDMPFGGQKMSGHGSGGLLHSMEEFLETKTILMKGS